MKFKYRKLIYICTFSIMLLGMMIFSTNNSFGKKGEEETKDTATATVSEVASGSSIGKEEIATGTAISNGLLMKDAYPEVNKLVEDFFTAKYALDEKAITELVDNVHYVGLPTLKKMAEVVEKVDGFVCYTIDGPEKDSYITYVYNEVKFKGIATKASSLDGFYIKRGEDGKLRIILGELPSEIQKIIDANSKREDVAVIIADVNERLKKEVKGDKELARLLKKLMESGGNPEGEKKEKKKTKKR